MPIEEGLERVEGVKISYGRIGNGLHNVLLIPSGAGSWRTDYQKQMLGGLRSEKFTLIGYDPPGLGLSRPPDRVYFQDDMLIEKSETYNVRDARVGHKLMEKLGLIPYSIMGWDDGGVTAMHIASQQRAAKPTSVLKLVLWGTHAYMTKDEAEIYDSVRDVNCLASEIKTPLVKLYGQKYFQTIWGRYMDLRKKMADEWNGDICKEILDDISQPTLILHGKNDWMCPDEHIEFLHEKLPNAQYDLLYKRNRAVVEPNRSVLYHEKGQHNLHMRHAQWFNQEVEFFLLQNQKMMQGFEKIGMSRLSYAKIGKGKHFLLCCPGVLGSWRTDFRKVLEGFDHDEFTIVAWDPPGYGQSKQTDREFNERTCKEDAIQAHKLMKKLNLVPFSVLGFDEGGRTALHLAQAAPRTVKRVVVWATRTYVTAEDRDIFQAIKDSKSWSMEARKPFIELYGDEYFHKTWGKYVEFMCRCYKDVYQGNICREVLPQLEQKLLVLHGGVGYLMPEAHARYIADNAPKARLEMVPDGKLNLANDSFDWFKRTVEAFLFEDEPRRAVKESKSVPND